MADNPQNNVLITRDGQACLGDFGIAGAFRVLYVSACDLETLRYMAPERHPAGAPTHLEMTGPSKESDVYSLALTSFSVSSSVVNDLTVY